MSTAESRISTIESSEPAFNKSSMGRLKAQILLQLQDLILQNNGVIFGGYVRDKIIHDKFAQDFYQARKNTETILDYDNPMHHPESWPWRTLLPIDIDIAMSTRMIKNLTAAISNAGYICRVLYTKKANIYLSSPVNLSHTKLLVKLKLHKLIYNYTSVREQIPDVMIDVIHKENLESTDIIPFGSNDFECNSLVISCPNTLDTRLRMDPFLKYQKLCSIIDDTVNLKAVPVNPAPYRMQKMLKKGFTIEDRYIIVKPPRLSKTYEGRCVICFNDFTGSVNELVKNKCCDASYHLSCYQHSCLSSTSYNNIINCAMCRQRNKYVTNPNTALEDLLRSSTNKWPEVIDDDIDDCAEDSFA